MAVENFICQTCVCANVCSVRKKLLAFDKEDNNMLPTNIRIINCEDYNADEGEGE